MSQTLFRSLRNIFRSRFSPGWIGVCARLCSTAYGPRTSGPQARVSFWGWLVPSMVRNHLAVPGRAEDVQLLAAGQNPGVEAFHRAVAGLDGGLAHPGGHRGVEPLEAERQVDLDPNPVAAPVLERLDRAMDGADLGAGDIYRAPRFFGSGGGEIPDDQDEWTEAREECPQIVHLERFKHELRTFASPGA